MLIKSFKCSIIDKTWGCNGFDIILEVWIASSGWSLWPLKKSENKYKR